MMQVMRISPKQMKKTNLFILISRSPPFRRSNRFAKSEKIQHSQQPRGQDAQVAFQAAEALDVLLLQGSDLTGLPPEPTARAVLGALRRHPEDDNGPGRYGCCCVAPPLQEVRVTPRHAAARPVGLCDCARRGEGEFNTWSSTTSTSTRSSVSGCSRRASSGGDGCRWGVGQDGRSCSHGRISILQQPFFSCLQHLFCKLHNNSFVKFGMIRHFASYRLVIGHSHGKLMLSTKRRSIETMFVACYFDLLCIEWSGPSVVCPTS